jgi:hypothetical protein
MPISVLDLRISLERAHSCNKPWLIPWTLDIFRYGKLIDFKVEVDASERDKQLGYALTRGGHMKRKRRVSASAVRPQSGACEIVRHTRDHEGRRG